jgi:hypothetical protein
MGDLKKAEEVLAQAMAASTTAPNATAEDRLALASRLAEVRQLQEEVSTLQPLNVVPDNLCKLEHPPAHCRRLEIVVHDGRLYTSALTP